MQRLPIWRRENNLSALARFWPAVREHLRHHWFFSLVQLSAVALLALWWRHLPVPGYAIGVLAVLAAVMSSLGASRIILPSASALASVLPMKRNYS